MMTAIVLSPLSPGTPSTRSALRRFRYFLIDNILFEGSRTDGTLGRRGTLLVVFDALFFTLQYVIVIIQHAD